MKLQELNLFYKLFEDSSVLSPFDIMIIDQLSAIAVTFDFDVYYHSQDMYDTSLRYTTPQFDGRSSEIKT